MEFIYENAELLTKLLVSWLPTLIFAFSVLIGTLVGIRRGARKSAILLVHSLAIFTLCITLFVLLVSVTEVDALLLTLINTIMGSENALERFLGVSVECETLKEVLLEVVLAYAEQTDDLSIIFKDNGAYILTLIDLVYRVTFGLVLYVLYFILIFIMYLVYCIFYPERRFKKKRNKQFQEGLAENPYQKKRLTGGIIGFSRSLVAGLVNLSFLGTILFIVAGGIGDKEYVDYDFEDENVNLIYDVFTSVGEYGNEGIFKVLNMVKDKNETPYYLFAADMIFQGGLEDVENGINENIYFREEIGTFIGFARDTFNLLLKYDDKHIVSELISGNYDGDIMDEALNIMSNPGFQSEFTLLIKTFDAETYVINLGLSLVNSCVANIDQLGLPEDGIATDILKILFKKGYLCEDIPYEKQLLNEKLTNPDEDASKYTLACLSANTLIKQSDISNVVSALFTVISIMGDKDFTDLISDTDLLVYTVRSLIPYIKNLSILSTEREAEINPVLKRLYSYVEYNVLTVEDSAQTFDLERNTKMYQDDTLDSISWIAEINALLDVCDDGLALFQNIADLLEDCVEPLDYVRVVFDKDSYYYNSNMELLDGVINKIGSSQLIGSVLSTKLVFTNLQSGLGDAMGADIPRFITYTNKYDSDGNIEEYGEVYNLLCAIRALADKSENLDLIETMIGGEMEPMELIGDVLVALKESKFEGKATLDYLIDSTLIRCIISSTLTSVGDMTEGLSIYMDDRALDQEYLLEGYRILAKEELQIFFDVAPEFLEIAQDFMNGDDDTDPVDKMLELLKSETVTKILKSKLVEGTVSNLLTTMLPPGYIVVPKNMTLVSTSEEDSELKKLINLLNSDIIDISQFFEDGVDYIEIIKDLNEEKLLKLLDSSIFHYTLSNVICGDMLEGMFTIVVPNTSKVALKNDSINYLVDKDSLVTFIGNITEIIPEDMDNFDGSELLGKVIKNRGQIEKDQIILATLSHYIATSDMFDGVLVITENLKSAGSKEKLENNFRRSPWNGELIALLDALDELLEISTNEDFTLDEEVLNEILPKFNTLNDKCVVINSDKTKLGLCYESEILIGTISHFLDEIFGDLVSNKEVLEGCKVAGTEVYTFENLQSLVDALIVFGLDFSQKDENGNITFDESSIVDSVLVDLPTYNKPNPDNRDGVSDLELIYGSAIIRDIFSSQIDTVLIGENGSGLIKEADAQNYLKDRYNAYKIEEIDALIELLSIFELTGEDLSQSSGDESLFDKIINNIGKINEGDNLDRLDKANVFGVLMTNQLEKNITVPSDALEGLSSNSRVEKRKLVKEEIRYLVDCIDILDVDLTDLNITELELTDEVIEAIAPSKVISAIMYKNIGSSGDLVIPATTLSNSLDYIIEEEFRLMLNCLKDEMDSFFEKSETNPSKYDITKIKSINIDDVDTDMIRNFTKSDILEATMIYTLVNNSSDTIKMPSSYKTAATMTALKTNKNNIWLSSNEILKVADALDVLELTNLDINEDSITNNFTYDNMNSLVPGFGKTKLEVIMDSAIMAGTLSNTIIDTLGKDMISSRVVKHRSIYNHTYESYTIEEINNVLYGINKVLGIDNLKDVDGTQVYDKIKDDNSVLDSIWSSRLLAGIITYKIYDSSVIKHHEHAYEEGIEIYKVDEIKTLFDILGNKDVDSITLDDISLSDIKSAITLKSDNTVDSYLLLRTLSHKLLNTKNIVVPKACIDDNSGSKKYLNPNDVIELIEAMEALDISNANVDFESVGTQKAKEQYAKAFESDIVRASITKMIKIDSSDLDIKILLGVEANKNLIAITKDHNNKDISILSSDELLRIIDSFNDLTGGGDSYEWKFDIEKIIEVYRAGKLGRILESNLFYVVISKNLTDLYVKIENKAQTPGLGQLIPTLPEVTINPVNVINVERPSDYNDKHLYDTYDLIVKDDTLSFVEYLDAHWSGLSNL